MVDPTLLCRKHLLGEHVETHMFVGTIRAGISIRGYVDGAMLDSAVLAARHDALAAEMLARGYKHKSPLAYVDLLGVGKVDVAANIEDLRRRCPECRANIEAAGL